MRIWKPFTLAAIFAIVGIAFTACDDGTSSSTDAGSGTDIGKRIIGTWVSNRFTGTWVFNVDGNLTRQYYPEFSETTATETYKFGVAGTKLAIFGDPYSDYQYSGASFDIYISPNGRTLILMNSEETLAFTKQ